MIAEMIFSDYPRTFLLCAFSIGVVFSIRNASNRKKVLVLACYELIVVFVFFWIFIVCTVFTKFYYESMISIAKWGIKWIFYFTIITILQIMVYSLLWEKNKVLKAVTLLFSIVIAFVPLYILF